MKEFLKTVLDYYAAEARQLPWRSPEADGTFDAYKILASEMMLQQTQVPRVIPKYHSFLATFPTVYALAAARQADVVQQWSGLGYNRRAKYLYEAAQMLQHLPEPWSIEDLVGCKGIGPNTAAAVRVYAYDAPEVFVETNIRTVFIHRFFKTQTKVADKELLPLIAKSLHGQDPRNFYWALMDYGSHLKKTMGNSAQKSTAYARQSPFAGSIRQIRGRIIKLLSEGAHTSEQLHELLADTRAPEILDQLIQEGLVVKKDHVFWLA